MYLSIMPIISSSVRMRCSLNNAMCKFLLVLALVYFLDIFILTYIFSFVTFPQCQSSCSSLCQKN